MAGGFAAAAAAGVQRGVDGGAAAADVPDALERAAGGAGWQCL